MVSSVPGDRARPDTGTDPLGGLELFGDLRRFDSIDSTNSYLMRQARAGAPGGVVAVADHQTAGRGRRGRRWLAEAGSSLLVSVLLRPEIPAARVHQIGASMALAAADACEQEAGLRPAIKWPNDLVVGERKLGGILSEAELEAGRVVAVVAGLGLNLRWPAAPPAEIRDLATALEEAAGGAAGRRTVSRDGLLACLLSSLDRRVRALLAGDEAQLAEYRRACSTLGRAVRVDLEHGSISGEAVDLDDRYRLIVEAGGARTAVAAGDVVHLRDLPRA
jgi:BirA family biotin operon repressor/biotin-[acetyl-CoA-carboxylase] ligase